MKIHTPGPWKYAADTEDILAGRKTVAVNIYSPSVRLDGHLASVGAIGMPASEIEANAALMAAAPEMLAVLELTYAELKKDDNDGFAFIRMEIQDVIAKARGEA